jgi:hypothetical protein
MQIDNEKYETLLNTEEIQRKIKTFESLDLSLASKEQVRSAFLDIFCVEYEGKKVLVFESYLMTRPSYENIYRVRKVDSFPKDRAPCERDFWAHPDAPQNRFNWEGEKVLYVSTDIKTTLLETGVRQREPFVLIQYTNTLPLFLCPSEVKNKDGYGNNSSDKLGLLKNFCSDLARTNVGEKERYKYKATRALVDLLYLLPDNLEETADGILYVSRHTGEMENIVIKGERLNKLAINNAWVASIDENNSFEFYEQIFIESGTIRFGSVSLSSIEKFARNISIVPY